MKKITLMLSFFLVTANLQAQDYLLSFTGSNSETISSVKVENLTQGTEKTLAGDDVLHLLGIATGVEQVIQQNFGLRVYPNPITETSNIEFNATVSGLASISVFDITGRKVISEQRNLAVGNHVFKLNNLSTGIYTLSVKSDSYSYSAKLVSQCQMSGTVSLSYVSTSVLKRAKSVKETKATIEMHYTSGDNLKITGISDGLKREIELIPTANETVEFDFTLMLGDFAEGGVIFYIFVEGDLSYVEGELHGLVCAVRDEGERVEWSNYVDIAAIPNQKEQSIAESEDVDGLAYSNAITQLGGTTAASICRDKTGNYSNWYLPTLRELKMIYTNRETINTTAIANSGTALSESPSTPMGIYWSSTESDISSAWSYNFFLYGGLSSTTNKLNTYRVRSVRAF